MAKAPKRGWGGPTALCKSRGHLWPKETKTRHVYGCKRCGAVGMKKP